MKKHINIPIFIPHLGCPNNCVFCNQRFISGHTDFDISTVKEEIETALSTKKDDQTAQIAFFGGSFTGIERSLMTKLLGIAKNYIDNGSVDGIRLSTRPDYIDREVLDILSEYGVTSVELGIQSMSQTVLDASKRGHTVDDARRAAYLIKEYGFEFVSQMMIGLPSSTPEDEIMTAEECIRMGADATRIYPTVVFKDSELCKMAEDRIYTPLGVAEAVARTKGALFVFYKHGIPCIRIGLCSAENLHSDRTFFAGPNHPAIGEMVESALYLDIIRSELEKRRGELDKNSEVTVFVAKNSLSKAIGQHKANKIALLAEYNVKSVKFVEISEILGYNIILDIK